MKKILLITIALMMLAIPAWGGWLQSGGTDYGYRMDIPLANPGTAGDRQIIVPFPGYFLKDQGKIQQSSYEDVHVTTSDGTTELDVTTTDSQLKFDWASMPQGVTTAYVYYGHASASAPTAADEAGSSGGTYIDNRFENGSEGATLADPPWTAGGSAWQNEEYDDAQTWNGSQSGYLKAHATLSSNITETVSSGMSTDGAELRIAVRFGETSQNKNIFDVAASNPVRGFFLNFNSSGNIRIYTTLSVTGYTQNDYTNVGTYTNNQWYEFRMVYDFTNDRFTLSYRITENGSWIGLKASGAADYNIPTCGSLSTTGGTTIAASAGNSLWIDDVQYSDSGITDTTVDTTVQAIRPNAETTTEGDTSPVYYAYGDDVEQTYIDSGAATTYYGESADHIAGITSGGRKYHYLTKYFEGAFPKGTLSAVKLYLYINDVGGIGENTTLKAYRFLNTGNDPAGLPSAGTTTKVYTGWSMDGGNDTPSWNVRFYNGTTFDSGPGAINWQTAGATHANEINTADGTTPTLDLTTASTPGYYSFTIPTAWGTAWQGDEYSQGVNITDSTDSAGANDRYATITNGLTVWEFQYTAIDADQYLGRKLSTDTYTLYSTFPTQDRYLYINDNYLGVGMYVNAERYIDIYYFTAGGRIGRASKNVIPSLSLQGNVPMGGFYFDPDEERFWIAGTTTTPYIQLGYSDQYIPTNWTWVNQGSTGIGRYSGMPKNGVFHAIYNDSSNAGLYYRTYTRSTGTWSSATQLAITTPAGTARALNAGINDTSTDPIVLNGSIDAYYPDYDLVKIGTEYIWYEGIDTGSNTIGTGYIKRGAYGTTAATHSASDTVSLMGTGHLYCSVMHDENNNCLHVVTTFTSGENAVVTPYTKVMYFRHNYADAAGTWYDSAGNTLSLPVNQLTRDTIENTDEDPAYGVGSIALSTGDFITAMLLNPDKTSSSAYSHTNSILFKLPDGGTSFTENDITAALHEMSLVDAGSNIVFISGVDVSTRLISQYIQSDDSGDTWTDAMTLTSHTLTAGELWSSSVSEKAFSDVFISYATHFAHHGAIYLEGVEFSTVKGGFPILQRLLRHRRN